MVLLGDIGGEMVGNRGRGARNVSWNKYLSLTGCYSLTSYVGIE